MEAHNLADFHDRPLVDWAAITRRLDKGFTQAPDTGGPNRHTCWLATIDADGAPHLTAVGAMWHEGAFWGSTGDGTRKGKNLARDPRCTLSVSMHDYDLVLEGAASKITDAPTVAKMAA